MEITNKITHYLNGKIKSIIPYINNKKNGKAQLFYSNGNKKGEIDYTDDLENGYIRTYYKNGSLESIETYENGLSNHDLIIYNPDGYEIYRRNSYEYINNYQDICIEYHRHF